MTDLLLKHPGLVTSRFTVGPSNQPGFSLFATLEFGEAVIRLPHRAIRLGIDAIYIRFSGEACEIPDDSREFKSKIPKSVATKRTEASGTELELETSNNLRSTGATDKPSIGVNVSRGKAKKQRTTASQSDEMLREVPTIVSTSEGSAVVWSIQSPPGSEVLRGRLLDNEVVMRILRTGTSTELRISGEIPTGAVCVIDHHLRSAHKNKCGLTRIIFGLSYCGQPFEIARLADGDLTDV